MNDFRPYKLAATEPTRSGAAVATIHDTDDRSFDVVCSRHWLVYDHGYRKNAGFIKVRRARRAAIRRAAEHAATCGGAR